MSDTRCSDKDYAHATQVWTAFECESVSDYHDIYLKCDLLLLTDFFERFRATCLAHYSFGSVHYYTATGLAWDASLRMTHVSLELIADIDMYHFIENSTTLNRPIYVGFSVLDLSKLHMYTFHYNHICVIYPRHGQLRLLFTDTDSLAYAVQTEDIYRYMTEDAATYNDFSEYPLGHPLYSAMNRKTLGFFKDELNSLPVQQLVGLRSKGYGFLCTGKMGNSIFQHTNPVRKKTAKGVKHWVKDADLQFAH